MKTKKLHNEYQVQWVDPKFRYIKCGSSVAKAFREFRKLERQGAEKLQIIHYECVSNLIPGLGWWGSLSPKAYNYSGKPGEWVNRVKS